VVDATAPGGVAMGELAHSAQADAIAIGSGAVASGAQSLAQGANASAANAGGVALGSGAQSSAIDAVAIGAGASASLANSVALGAGSVTTVGALSNYIAYGLGTPQSSAGEINVGNRQITGVAAGKAGTDAVNVSQLAAVTTQLTTLIINQAGAGFPSTVITRIKQRSGVQSISVVGHTDRIGPETVNQPLSLARAETVREYMVNHGLIGEVIHATGVGSRDSTTQCPVGESRAAIACLQPDRRVSIEVRAQ
jgi:autotransporter adhesin